MTDGTHTFSVSTYGVEKRVENGVDIPFYPKIYFCLILRRSLDKTFTKKSWQNIYEEVLTKHLRWNLDKVFTMKSWQSLYDEIHENSRGEKRGEKTGEISPLHLKYIFGVNFMKIHENSRG